MRKRPSLVGLALAATLLAGSLAFLEVRAAAQVKQGTETKIHKVAIQVNQNEKGVMDLALNNAQNISDYYGAKGEDVAIEILHMLRTESPVKNRISVAAPIPLTPPVTNARRPLRRPSPYPSAANEGLLAPFDDGRPRLIARL